MIVAAPDTRYSAQQERGYPRSCHDQGRNSRGRNQTAKADAMEFLRAALVGAPVPAAELSRAAHERGLVDEIVLNCRDSAAVGRSHRPSHHAQDECVILGTPQ